MTALDTLLAALPRWTLVGGKGGVGKTTCAAALADASAQRGVQTLLLSTDPARSLGDALGAELTDEPRLVPRSPTLHAYQLDAGRARDAFLDRWRDDLITIVDRGTYLERDEITGLIDAALPGADEAMALLALSAHEAEVQWHRIIVDTAPTGHTLRLLGLPETFRALIDLLEAMQAKHRFIVQALTHRYRVDAADAFLDDMRQQLAALSKTLTDPRRAAMLLVTRPEPVVVAESVRYLDALDALHIAVGGLVINAVPAEPTEAERDALRALEGLRPSVSRYHVPALGEPPMGVAGIRAWAATLVRGAPPEQHGTSAAGEFRHRPAARAIETPARRRRPRRHAPSEPDRPVARALTIVGGKGGVGKTTTACALALATAGPNRSVLVVSTDPAPSIADTLEQPIGDDDVAIANADGLFARQMDADAAFARLRAEYEARIDALFDRVMGAGVDAAHDRRIMRDLLALAPPGIDELYALSLLGETIAEERFACVIVDPAPTGHLLRLLEMPALALDWTHRLLRLMLKYKEVGGLGDAAEDLLAFAKRTRGVMTLLADSARAGVLVVALDEPLVRRETSRLIALMRERDVDVIGILWNRASNGVEPLPASPAVPQFGAPAVLASPRGVDALRRWSEHWYPIARSDA